MPDIHESSYNAWMGRKKTTLRRPTLDCGCVNNGEVSFHLWCDRLSCQEHADAPHDCGEFKGTSQSGIEEESVPAEAVVEAPALRPLTLSPETYRALYGPVESPVEALRPAEADGCQVLRMTVPLDTDGLAAYVASHYVAFTGQAHLEPLPALAADELVEPDPHGWFETRQEAYEVGRRNGAVGYRQTARGVQPLYDPAGPKHVPWWRRMLPGGTR